MGSLPALDGVNVCLFAEEYVRMGVPGSDWSRAELESRAVWEHGRIDQSETYSPRYWFLGKALLEVRKDIALPQWKAWRDGRELDRTRCDRAQLLARAFATADELQEVPLLKALSLANERLGLPARQTPLDAKFRRWLTLANTKARQRRSELNDLAAPDQLRPLIAELVSNLVEIDRACQAIEPRRAKHPK